MMELPVRIHHKLEKDNGLLERNDGLSFRADYLSHPHEERSTCIVLRNSFEILMISCLTDWITVFFFEKGESQNSAVMYKSEW